MKKYTLKQRLQYQFDNIMSKGSVALVGMLFLATALVAMIVGLLMVFLDGGDTGWGENIWLSIMHIIDAGTITGASTEDMWLLVLLSIATICGLFVTSILIGIITTGFENKLNELRKGASKVLEKEHTVILGFNDNVYSLISELVIANENRKRPCIVILAEMDKEEMDTAIAENIEDTKNTRIICRSGSFSEPQILDRCSIEYCRSIIINDERDFVTIKAILSINNYLKERCLDGQYPHIVSSISEKGNYEATSIISMGNVETVLVEDFIARIIAQACRQPGLANVLVELFDYDGDELYFESFAELTGKSFGEVLNYFEKAAVFGIQRGEKTLLAPSMDTILEVDDELILLVEDDGMAKTKEYKSIDVSKFKTQMKLAPACENILIIGINSMLQAILEEMDDFLHTGSKVIVANDVVVEDDKLCSNNFKNISIEYCECNTLDRVNLAELVKENISHILLLSEDSEDYEMVDSKTLLKLIHLRDIGKKNDLAFNITSELKRVENQKVAQITDVKDLVIGSNIVNLILTQISENRKLLKVFQELLDDEGSEIHIRPAENYVKLDTAMNFYNVTSVVSELGEVAIGYKKKTDSSFEVITNPLKSDEIVFGEGDAIIVLSLE